MRLRNTYSELTFQAIDHPEVLCSVLTDVQVIQFNCTILLTKIMRQLTFEMQRMRSSF
jgi:hypothetical protein